MSDHTWLTTVDPEILGGVPVFTGTRVPIQAFIDHWEHGDSLETFLTDFPTVTRDQAKLAIDLAEDGLIDKWPEIERRSREIDEGTAITMTWEEVKAEARRRLRLN